MLLLIYVSALTSMQELWVIFATFYFPVKIHIMLNEEYTQQLVQRLHIFFCLVAALDCRTRAGLSLEASFFEYSVNIVN